MARSSSSATDSRRSRRGPVGRGRGLVAALSVSAAASLALAPPAARAEPAPSCALALSIDAGGDDALRLRQVLAAGALGQVAADGCAAARVSMARDRTSIHVTVARGGDLVARDVGSIEHAAVWVESWLVPPDPASAPTAIEYAQAALESAPQRRRTARLELLGALSLDGDLSVWGGPELGVVGLLTRAFWLGGAVGVPFWVQDAEVDEGGGGLDDDAPVVRLSLRAGGRLHLANRLALDLGGGVGFTWDTQIDLPVNPMVELVVALVVDLGRGFSFVAAVLGRVHLLRDASRSAQLARDDGATAGQEPPALSLLAGELRAGFAYTFGRARAARRSAP